MRSLPVRAAASSITGRRILPVSSTPDGRGRAGSHCIRAEGNENLGFGRCPDIVVTL
jgi:hypothetical protein